MLKCGSCVWLKLKPRPRKGRMVFCYDLGFHEENRACRNWLPNFSYLRNKESFLTLFRSLSRFSKRELDVVEQLVKIQKTYVKRRFPYRVGEIVYYSFGGKWIPIFVESIFKLEREVFLRGLSCKNNFTSFTLPITSVKLKKKLKVRLINEGSERKEENKKRKKKKKERGKEDQISLRSGKKSNTVHKEKGKGVGLSKSRTKVLQ